MSDVKEQTPVQIAQDVRNKAIRLFTYLKEVCQLRFIMVRDCRNYDQVLWFNEIPREPECFCVAWSASTETSESWVEIRRSSEPVWPNIPDACKDWVSLAEVKDSSQIPTLRERLLGPSLEGQELIFAVSPRISGPIHPFAV